MRYNYSTNILAWVVSCILCFYMITIGKYDLGLPMFILCFTQIQLFEALIWIDIKNENINNNSKHTKKISAQFNIFTKLLYRVPCNAICVYFWSSRQKY